MFKVGQVVRSVPHSTWIKEWENQLAVVVEVDDDYIELKWFHSGPPDTNNVLYGRVYYHLFAVVNDYPFPMMKLFL